MKIFNFNGDQIAYTRKGELRRKSVARGGGGGYVNFGRQFSATEIKHIVSWASGLTKVPTYEEWKVAVRAAKDYAETKHNVGCRCHACRFPV